MKQTQVIDIDNDTVLIFKIKDVSVIREEYIRYLEERTGCKCIILEQDMELEKVLKKKEALKKDKLKAIYKAEIFEYENGRTDIAYECDKENNKACSKECCTIYNYCTHTLNKKYAKNFIKENFKLK